MTGKSRQPLLRVILQHEGTPPLLSSGPLGSILGIEISRWECRTIQEPPDHLIPFVIH